jgi:hypothetical protein
VVALPKVRTSVHAETDSRSSGSFKLSASDLGHNIALDNKPTPGTGAQQASTSASQAASAALTSTKQTTRRSLGHNDISAEGTALVEAPPPKPAVVSPPHHPDSTVSVRSNVSKQQHHVPAAKLPADLLHRRDFEVKSIRKKHPGNMFTVRWKSTWVPLEAIVKGSDRECSYVEADGAKWTIRKELKSRVSNGLQERKVRWTNTKEPLENLANAQEAISIFEMTEQQGLDVRHRTVLTFEESKFPRGIVRPQSERDYAASQRWVACTWPRIRPHNTLDLYPAIYRIQMELLALKPSAKANFRGKSYRDLMRRPQVRRLEWREDYIQSGRSFYFSRRKRAALFLQVTGELETNGPCTRCLGEKLAPFVGCVRTAPNHQSWLGGACANCGTQDSSFCLHHHKGVLGRGESTVHNDEALPVHVLTARTASYAQPSNKARAGHHQEPSNASGVQGIFYADITANDDDDVDDDEDDDSDSDADSDDEHDDEVDPDKDSEPSNHLVVYASAETQQEQSYEYSNAALSSAEAYPSPLSANDHPAAHACRGKLPKISKPRRVAASVSPPPTPLTSQLPQDSTDLDEFAFQPKEAAGVAALGDSHHSVGNFWPRVKSIAEILEETPTVDEDFLPDSLEEDFMELLWRHETPAPYTEGRRPNTGDRIERNSIVPSAGAQPTDAAVRGLEDGRRGNEHSTRIDNPPPATVHGERQPSTTVRRKRRADSLEPRSKRPSFGFCGQNSSGSASHCSPGPSTNRRKPSASEPPSRTFVSIRSLEKMEPKSIHQGCVAGQPCKNHEGGNRPKPRDPLIKVYHNTLDRGSHITAEQADYIIFRSNCYWAWLFTWIWKLWCDEQGGVDNQEYTQVELLLSCPDKLRGAAWDCCPRGESLVVELD